MTDVAPTLTSLVDQHVRLLTSLVEQVQRRDRDSTVKSEHQRADADVPGLATLVREHVQSLTALLDQLQTRDTDQPTQIAHLQRAVVELATDLADVRQRVAHLERRAAAPARHSRRKLRRGRPRFSISRWRSRGWRRRSRI
jgi:hypothetical protein